MEKKIMEVAAGVEPIYANMVRIAQAPADLVLDFGHILPAETKGMINARIVMSPISAKMLLLALAENIKKYEEMNGMISIPKPNLADQLFRGLTAPKKDGEPEAPKPEGETDGPTG